MNAEQVVKKILDDARAKAEEIEKAAAERVAAERERFEREIAAYTGETEQRAQKKAADEKEHNAARARMEAARSVLSEKQKIIDEVFRAARKKMIAMPSKAYREWISDMLGKAVETGKEEVILDTREERIDAAFLKGIKVDKAKSKDGHLTLSEQRRDLGGGGFILVNGKVRTNVSFNQLFAEAREELEYEIATILYNREQET